MTGIRINPAQARHSTVAPDPLDFVPPRHALWLSMAAGLLQALLVPVIWLHLAHTSPRAASAYICSANAWVPIVIGSAMVTVGYLAYRHFYDWKYMKIIAIDYTRLGHDDYRDFTVITLLRVDITGARRIITRRAVPDFEHRVLPQGMKLEVGASTTK